MDEKRLYDILGQNAEVPDMVNKKLEQTYGLITQKKRPMKRRGFRPVRTVLVASVLSAALCVTATAAYQLFRQDVASWAVVGSPGRKRKTMTKWDV